MVVMGDVLTVVAVLFGICLSTWAMVLGMGMMFSSRAAEARSFLEQRPWRAIGGGALWAGTLGLLATALANAADPGTKLFGTLVLLGLFAAAALGASGLALLLAERMQAMEPSISGYAAFSRSSGLMVVALLVPVLGWFLFAPLILLAGLGAGMRVVLRGRKSLAVQGDV